jgi:uncharacterized membrane protein
MTLTRSSRIPLAIVTVLAALIGLVSLRLVSPTLPFVPGNVGDNANVLPWLPIHAGLSSIALLIGPFQFWTDKTGRRRSWHKIVGRVYVVCCLLSAPAGFILGLGASAGPLAQAGFVSLAVVWFVVTAMGYWTARNRQFEAHRRWMIRSYAATFAAVTLRLYLPIAPILGFDFMDGYRIISWAAWVPNLLVAEWLLRRPLQAPIRL